MTDTLAERLARHTTELRNHRGPTPPANGGQPWFRIDTPRTLRNADNTETSSARIMLYGVIGESFWEEGNPASDFVRALNDLDVDEIELHINSPGGSIFEGVSMLNGLRQHRATVRGYVDGLAASAASFIAAGCDELIMGRNTQLMIHDGIGFCLGNAALMRETADLLDRLSNDIAAIYAEKSDKKTLEQWRDVMRAEAWYSADEAVEAGLADRVDTGSTQKAKDPENLFDLSAFNYAGRSKAPAPTNTASHQPPAEPAEPITPTQEGATMASLSDGIRARLGIKAEAQLDDDGLLAALDEALAEQSNDSDTADPAPVNAAPPAGTMLVDTEQYASLQRDAAMGRQAREEQLAADRDRAVQNAIDTGRIPPSRREHWTAQLKADPGAREVLDSLPTGTVNLAPTGYTNAETGDDDVRSTDDFKNWSL